MKLSFRNHSKNSSRNMSVKQETKQNNTGSPGLCIDRTFSFSEEESTSRPRSFSEDSSNENPVSLSRKLRRMKRRLLLEQVSASEYLGESTSSMRTDDNEEENGRTPSCRRQRSYSNRVRCDSITAASAGGRDRSGSFFLASQNSSSSFWTGGD